ncbi:VanW family protein [Miltoncostaea oceani]|uniref:VanW family protein n=1 Tax=Miltoncostaea oceani TaxID=2843216 RepID=UPI001C3E5850|nr:VanW family protein [Miltoncostaea oceani]
MPDRTRRRLVLVGVAVGVVVLAIGGALALGNDDAAPASVTIAGRDVSGLDAAGVERVARARAKELLAQPLEIVRTDDPGYRVRVTRASLDARPRIRQAVAAALEPRTIGGRLLSLVGAASEREVPLRFTLDPREVSRLVTRVTREVNDAPRAAGLEVGEEDITLVPGAPGYGVAPDELRSRILALPATIALTPGPLPPPVTDEAAAAARERALAVIDAPVDVTLDGNGVAIEPEVLRAALRFEADPPDLDVTLDPDVLYEDIASAFETREQPARDAGFRVSGTNLRLITSRVGRRLDMDAIAAAIVADPDAPSVRARFEVSRPTRTTAEVRALRITELVSEFSTPYNCCEPRVTNIQRAAELLDGTIIPPGGRFSLNEALGQRTLERGFVEAPQIAAGRLEDAVGGGVSQVSTTMYNAAFFAGLEIVTHTPHQFWISRYPQGREATLSYGGPEMIFVNDWDAGILISAVASDNAVTIRFFSSLLDRRVETETGPQTNVVAPVTRETVDPSLAPGERVVQQEAGGSGFTVTYTRKVWKGDELRRDETYRWTYDAQDAYVDVGPAAPRRPTRPTRPGGGTGTTPGEPTAPDGGTTTAAPDPPPAAPPQTTTGGGGPAPPPP